MQVSNAVGTSVADGQVTADRVPVPENAVSVTPTSLSVTLPVLVTTKEYVTVCPAEVTVVGFAVLAIVSAGSGVAVTVVVEGGDVGGGPDGGVPVAVAVLVTEPASTSAWVTV